MDTTRHETRLGPTSEEAVDQVRAMIREGRVLRGGRLPGERVLAGRLQVSRSTLRTALDALEAAGEVLREPGRGGGTFATQPNINWPLASDAYDHRQGRVMVRDTGQGHRGVPAMMSAQGFVVTTRVISARMDAAVDDVANALGVPSGAPVIVIERVRYADGEPLSWETMHLSAERFPDLLARDLTSSLWEMLRTDYGVAFGPVRESIEIALADRSFATHINALLGQPTLKVARIAMDLAGATVEYSIDYLRGDRVRLRVRTDSPAESS